MAQKSACHRPASYTNMMSAAYTARSTANTTKLCSTPRPVTRPVATGVTQATVSDAMPRTARRGVLGR